MTKLRSLVRSQLGAAFFSCSLALPLAFSACDSDEDKDDTEETKDAGKTDSGTKDDAGKDAGAVSDCVKSPKTHLELINACTDAEVVDKKPNLPKFLADGGLPSLP
ncbi:MAG: hypothetical protein RL701_4499 [Pseudomonadota bacterium]|jgi:hypothetical protein